MYLDAEDFIEHCGKKGMKWGQNRALNKTSRSTDRAAGKADRAKSNEKRNKDIDRARARFDSGKARSDFKKAKATYKQEKQVVGSREAKKALNKVKDKNIRDYNKSREAKSGKETTIAVLSTVGLIGAQVLMIRAS